MDNADIVLSFDTLVGDCILVVEKLFAGTECGVDLICIITFLQPLFQARNGAVFDWAPECRENISR